MTDREKSANPADVLGRALEELQDTVSGIARSGPMMLFALDHNGVFTVMDGGLLIELGEETTSLVGQDLATVFRSHPEIRALGRRLLAGETLRKVPIDYGGRFLELWAAPSPSAADRKPGATGIVVDVSARVAAEIAVRGAAESHAILTQHASDLIVVLARDGTVRSANPAALKVLGSHAEVGSLLDVGSLVNPDNASAVMAYINAILDNSATGPPVEFKIVDVTGAWRVVQSVGQGLFSSERDEFVVTLRDVTERRISDERLRQSASRQAALADLGRWALVGLAFPSLRDDAVSVLAAELDADFVHVFETTPDGAFLTLTSGHGHGPTGPELLSTEPTSSPISFALVTQEPVVCGDLALEERFEVPDLWTRAEAMSVIEVPISGQDSPTGVLGVGRRTSHDFPEEDVNFVVAVANVLAAAAARARAEGAIREQALQDPLTGLPNRLVLADHGLTAAAPKPSDLSGVERTVLVLDIDRFKEINDTLGHALGDLVLLEVARRLRELGSPFDLVARLGGDEFAVVASTSRDRTGPEEMGARLLATLAEAIEVGGVRLRLRGSVGIAMPDFDEAGKALDVSALLRRAEVAMYQAKVDHRGVRRYSDDLERTSLSRLELASELPEAIERGELRLDYQPKVDALSGAITGVEALVRWQHPDRGLLMPDLFIPLAEQTGMIRELTNWVLARALSECAGWHRAGRALPVAVNLSASTVHDPELLESVTAAVTRSGLRPESIELEITESAVMRDPTGALRSLQALVDRGIRLSLDDFGTGYSSLSYLQKLPVHSVKIDKSFVAPLLSDETARAIVRSVIDLSHSLHLSVIAEGVESAEAVDHLVALGCDALQGFHIAVPMSADRLERWIAAHPPMSPARPRP